jgi:hypothetical protein
MITSYFESAALIAESDPSAGHMQDDLDAAEIIVYQIVQRSIHEFVIDRDLAASFVAGYANNYERLAEARPLGSGAAIDRPDVAEADVYLIVELEESDSSEVTFGDRQATLTAASPRTAFHVAESGWELSATSQVDYYLVAVPR